MIKLNGNIRCPKCDRGTIQFLVRQHDSPTIQFQTSCSRCKTKVYFVLTISREEPLVVPAGTIPINEPMRSGKLERVDPGIKVDPNIKIIYQPTLNSEEGKTLENPNATQTPPVKSQDNIGENKPAEGEKANVLPNPPSESPKESQEDELTKLIDGLD